MKPGIHALAVRQLAKTHQPRAIRPRVHAPYRATAFSQQFLQPPCCLFSHLLYISQISLGNLPSVWSLVCFAPFLAPLRL